MQTHYKAKRHYGGVCILLKDEIYRYYTVSTVDQGYDGILAISLKCKNSNMSFLIIATYLPPENSPFGRNSIEFFEHLTSIIYTYQGFDMYVIAGDMNARVGKKFDSIKDIDNVKLREVIDNNVNNHGNELINFLLETNFGIVNGRVTPHNDNFTSVSVKGKAVVDYVIVPLQNMKYCDYFRVHTATEIMSKLCAENDKIPDHSLLEFKFHRNEYLFSKKECLSEMSSTANCMNVCLKSDDLLLYTRKFRRKDMLNIHVNQQQISTIEATFNEHSMCDIYEQFMHVYNNVFNGYMNCNKNGKNNSKPFWNSELKSLWQNCKQAERHYLSSSGNIRNTTRSQFILKQKIFQNRFRYYKR